MSLEECKYIIKEKEKYITNDIKVSSDKPDKEDSEEEKSDEENYIEEEIRNFLRVSVLRKLFISKKINTFCGNP